MYPWLTPTLDKLKQRASTQQLHHGLLFVADQGVGEQSLVESLVQTLLCATKSACGECKSCKLYRAKSHPDMKYVVSEKPSIGVDLIREVSEFVTTTSQMLGNKVVIISNIETMTESASNSLLKTLEEPSKDTFILLTTTKPNALLATITSRCEKIRLSLPSIGESLAWLATQTTQAVDEEGLMAFSGSALDYLASLSADASNYAIFCDDLALLQHGQISELLLAEKCKTDATLILSWTYQKVVALYKRELFVNQQISAQSTQANLLQVAQLVEDCQQANRKIAQAGINKSLILQQIFCKYKTLTSLTV